MKILFISSLLFCLSAKAATSISLIPEGYPIFNLTNEMSNKFLVPSIQAINFTASGSGETTYDFKIPDHSYIVGVSGFFSGQNAGDFVKLSVVDVDNVMGLGAGAVLATPITKYWINPANNTQEAVGIGYPLFARKDLYLRFSYTTTNIFASVVNRYNLIMHKIVP